MLQQPDLYVYKTGETVNAKITMSELKVVGEDFALFFITAVV